MTRALVLLACALGSLPAWAHEGHGATPAHVHVEGLPVDLGLIALTLAAMAPVVLRAWRARLKASQAMGA